MYSGFFMPIIAIAMFLKASFFVYVLVIQFEGLQRISFLSLKPHAYPGRRFACCESLIQILSGEKRRRSQNLRF